MNKVEGYIPQADRKKILLLCDDIRLHSGVATMAREIVSNSAHHYNWFQLGAALNHPDAGKVFDVSKELNKKLKIDDADVKIMSNNGYGNQQLVRNLIRREKPDGIFIFTDPRYWMWLFEMEREIRSKIPIFFLNIWDDFPAPLYNKDFYNSVDLLMAISKQTKLVNEIVLGEDAKNKIIKYVPHGIDHQAFFPIKGQEEEFQKYKLDTYKGKDVDFTVFFNSRNIQRKHPHDLVLGYRLFCDMLPKEEAKKCAMIMHTAALDKNGTDLRAVKEALCDPEYVDVRFSQAKLNSAQMNTLYNLADVTVLPSSNEGWGLSLTESMMAGTMVIANTTGGMQDQMRFVDDNGEWFTPNKDVPSNHRGTYKKHGIWAVPLYPSNISLAGSPVTPYIYDDRCRPEDIAEAIYKVYKLGKDERNKRGMKGRLFAMSKEAMMTAENMAGNVISAVDETFDKFVPRKRFDLSLVEPPKAKYIEHKLTGY
tara:strand:+ start:6119 stop:7558 length:1440 start_codon:yes stop_codon:yes gene_type:complete